MPKADAHPHPQTQAQQKQERDDLGIKKMLQIILTTNNPPVGNPELINCFEYVLLPAVYQYNVATRA